MIASLLLLQLVQPLPVPQVVPPPPQAANPCGTDARCRLEYARFTESERRRAAFFQALPAYADQVERSAEEVLPHRERHPFGADFMTSSQYPGTAALIGYTLAWPVRVEFFAGTGKSSTYTEFYDPNSGAYSYSQQTLHMSSYGFQGRFYLGPWMFSPFVTAGLGWGSGTMSMYEESSQGFGSGPTGDLSTTAHTFYSGVGLDFQWNWVHLAAGYRLAWAFFTAASLASDPQHHPLPPDQVAPFSSMLDDKMHAISFEVGARY